MSSLNSGQCNLKPSPLTSVRLSVCLSVSRFDRVDDSSEESSTELTGRVSITNNDYTAFALLYFWFVLLLFSL